MTAFVYYQDQYKKELDAKVLKADSSRIILDKTIFIPQSSNEPGDCGKINNFKIAGSKKEGDNIWHIFPKQVPFKEGDAVKLELDWGKRLSAMRLHSALHLLAGPFEKNFGKRPVAGVVKGKEAQLVFKKPIEDEIISKAMEQANKDIETGVEIKNYWDEKRKGFRWTQVNDYIPIPDGGLLVKNTKEIGKINLVSKETEQGKQKIVISIG